MEKNICRLAICYESVDCIFNLFFNLKVQLEWQKTNAIIALGKFRWWSHPGRWEFQHTNLSASRKFCRIVKDLFCSFEELQAPIFLIPETNVPIKSFKTPRESSPNFGSNFLLQ
jgi:hypothetical protein